jgi:formate dehydrogenase major subunit
LNTEFTFQLNGHQITAKNGETILIAAENAGVSIPRLCFQNNCRPDGNCRACVVEIEGEKNLAASCSRLAIKGLVVYSNNARAQFSQKMVIKMLSSDLTENYNKGNIQSSNTELFKWVTHFDIEPSNAVKRTPVIIDFSNPAITVDLGQCIQCTRCVRACRETQVNDVIGISNRGSDLKITFDLDTNLGESSCVSCGECVQACPTNALTSNGASLNNADIENVNSVCPYCGVGCLLTFHVESETIKSITGRNGPSNKNRLCVKGRYGFDYVHHIDRLTKPLIRREGMIKTADLIPKEKINDYFREATWSEALEFAATGLKKILDINGGSALAGLGSAKGSNEEAYAFQKLIRSALKTNNVDHCTRLCHASSVAAMLEMLGNAGVSNQVEEIALTDVAIVIGARPTANHPVAATFMKNAAKDGTKLIIIDPYKSDLTRHANFFLQFHPGTDVLLLNSIMSVIIEENLHDKKFIEERTTDFFKLEDVVRHYTPESVSSTCGIEADTIRSVARIYAKAQRAMIFWGMGISQHIHGTDNARCLIALALLTGNIGKKGAGIHPLRGQNNVQGASDAGLIPMVYPDYQSVTDTQNKKKFEKKWDTTLNDKMGLTVTEIVNGASQGSIKGMYIMGENPAMSDPNLNHARAALANLEHLVIQDIFFTETAGFADVILPASAFPEKTGSFTNTDRRVQLGRQAILPPGDARQDLDIIHDLAEHLNQRWTHRTAPEVFEEMTSVMPSIGGLTWELLGDKDSITYPYRKNSKQSEAVLFKETFNLPSGKAKFTAAHYSQAAELPSNDFPLVLITGRQLEHWHTGTMTRRAKVLNSLEPEAFISMNSEDMKSYQIKSSEIVTLRSRRGEITAAIKLDNGLQTGNVFMPFCYVEAAANLLTIDAIDPIGKIPEFKHCAVQVSKVATQ